MLNCQYCSRRYWCHVCPRGGEPLSPGVPSSQCIPRKRPAAIIINIGDLLGMQVTHAAPTMRGVSNSVKHRGDPLDTHANLIAAPQFPNVMRP